MDTVIIYLVVISLLIFSSVLFVLSFAWDYWDKLNLMLDERDNRIKLEFQRKKPQDHL